MAQLGENRWGKSGVRVSKIHRGRTADDFSDVTVQVLLEGDVEAAHLEGDNSAVLPTDTMRNTIYALAQDHLGKDLERFGERLCERFLSATGVRTAGVTLEERIWQRASETGFIGGGSERRIARVVRGEVSSTSAGVEGLVVLKTRGSSFEGFPRDEYTTLPEASDRLLASAISADWLYSEIPADTHLHWGVIRTTLLDRFLEDWSASVQHQGYQMAEAALAVAPEVSEITIRMPNQHHLHFDLTRFGMVDEGVVFHPVSEPYGDISLTVTR